MLQNRIYEYVHNIRRNNHNTNIQIMIHEEILYKI